MAKMKRVIRWEDKDNGLGPYTTMDYHDIHDKQELTRHPVPQVSKPMVKRRFAFSTPKQMNSWFNPEEQHQLSLSNQEPNVYEVHPERVESYRKHVSFDKEFAKKLPTPRIVKEE